MNDHRPHGTCFIRVDPLRVLLLVAVLGHPRAA